ncbi:MAG: MBL fold metallo-hydrolase [Acidobacteriota bacterium]
MRRGRRLSGWRRQAVWFAGIATVVLGSGVLHNLVAQRDLSDVKIRTEHVAGNVHVFFGAGGNIGVSAGPDGLIMIDDQFSQLADKIKTALKSLNSGDLAFVLNTHYHGDHTGSNETFGREAPIIAQTNVRKRLSDPDNPPLGSDRPMGASGLPVVTFDQSLALHFNGEEIQVVHFPTAHTDGDSVIFFTKSNVVHMGDTFFAGRFPFVDLDGGGDVAGLTRDIRKILERLPEDVKIIPGHGPVSTKDDLRAYLEMLVGTTAIVDGKMKAGKTLDEIKAEGLPEKWDEWGSGFIKTDRWLETVQKSLIRANG